MYKFPNTIFAGLDDADKAAQAKTALEYVDRVRNSPCTVGTEMLLPVEFDHTMWNEYANIGVRMANLLTKIIIQGNNTLKNVNEEFLFDLVRNNVDGDTPIFGSGIALEPYVYPGSRLFCPYAFKKDQLYAHDLSLNYDYLDSEYIAVLRKTDWSEIRFTSNFVKFRYGAVILLV